MTDNELAEKLIIKVSPLNNNYRRAVRAGEPGAKVLEIMWEVGEILKKEGVKKVHPISWKIYGKAPGVRKSYITRDFLSYCFRIRNYFSKKSDIKKLFPSLARYSIFREAFPLLDNPKFELPLAEKEALINLMNSSKDQSSVKRKIQKIKKMRIGVVNPRDRRLKELERQRRSVENFHNKLKSELRSFPAKAQYLNEIMAMRDSTRNKFGRLLFALAHEGYDALTISRGEIPERLEKLISELQDIYLMGVEGRNRFRRVCSPAELIEIADIVFSSKNKRSIERLREKLKT